MSNTASFYVGTYSARGGAGIYQVEVELKSGAMRIASETQAPDPSYMALSPDGRTLYALEESVAQASVTAFEINADGALRLRNRIPVPGLAPCHIAASPDGRWLVTSNYVDGSHTVVAVQSDGSLAGAVHQSLNTGDIGPHERQDSAHAHFAEFHDLGSGKLRVYSCDLGIDRVMAFDFDPIYGSLTRLDAGGASLPPATGPRHLAIHPDLPIFYVLGELNAVLHAYRLSPVEEGSVPTLIQEMPTLPLDYAGVNFGAAIRISPDERVVTVSNRGIDRLSSFAINPDPDSGLLKPLGDVSCGGEWPRDFAYVGSELLVVANERSDNLAAFRVGASGLPEPLGTPDTRLALPSPACIVVPPIP